MSSEILALDATAQADAVARGDVTALELLEAAIAEADAAEIGAAIPIRFDDLARQRAKEPLAGPFAGVPFLLKDLRQEYAGQPHTAGAAPWRHRIAPAHSAYTRRCLEAGLVIFGRTATPELGLRATTESQLWGPARNPWDRDRTPGGSSGGSAAAVAAGVVAMAGASDGGGSIRIPASFCGLFGLKPSSGRVSFGQSCGLEWEGASVNGVLTRSVRDSARMLDVLCGPEPGDPFPLPKPATPFADDVGRRPGRLRIGFHTASPFGGSVDPACATAVTDAAHLLEGLGHHVEPATPAFDGAALAASFLTMYLGQVAAEIGDQRGFEIETEVLGMLGRALPAARYSAARLAWNTFARALGVFHETYDIFMLPSVAAPPARIGELATPAGQLRAIRLLRALNGGKLMLRLGMLETIAAESLARTPFTQLSNLTYTPSMSVPLAMASPTPGTPALPIGVQFVARYGEEAMLLRLAAQLETAAPWAARRPVGTHAR